MQRQLVAGFAQAFQELSVENMDGRVAGPENPLAGVVAAGRQRRGQFAVFDDLRAALQIHQD
ncbi:MAG: hypothetical protein ACK6D4_09915, partial [Planctomyces sp.]